MKKLFVLIPVLFLFGCSESTIGANANDNINPSESCLEAGKTCEQPPGDDKNETCANACCTGLSSVETSSNGSTGYTTYTCLDTANCKKEGESVSVKGTVCCENLVAKDSKCIKIANCTFNGEAGMLVYGNYREKGMCIAQSSCISSGSITGECKRCCVGSKYAVAVGFVGGPVPRKCLVPGEREPEGWEISAFTAADEEKWKDECLAY